MDRSLLIIGKPQSGKTTEAKKILKQFSNDEVIQIYYKNQFSRKTCCYNHLLGKASMKVIYIESSGSLQELDDILKTLPEEVYISEVRKDTVLIKPKYLIVFSTTDEFCNNDLINVYNERNYDVTILDRNVLKFKITFHTKEKELDFVVLSGEKKESVCAKVKNVLACIEVTGKKVADDGSVK
jgi:tRNA uridine 5-carbamoylmethylation protein Kti12